MNEPVTLIPAYLVTCQFCQLPPIHSGSQHLFGRIKTEHRKLAAQPRTRMRVSSLAASRRRGMGSVAHCPWSMRSNAW